MVIFIIFHYKFNDAITLLNVLFPYCFHAPNSLKSHYYAIKFLKRYDNQTFARPSIATIVSGIKDLS